MVSSLAFHKVEQELYSRREGGGDPTDRRKVIVEVLLNGAFARHHSRQVDLPDGLWQRASVLSSVIVDRVAARVHLTDQRLTAAVGASTEGGGHAEGY